MACNPVKFGTLTAKWLAEEQTKEIKKLGNTSLAAAALGFVGLGFAEALALKEDSFNLLANSQRNVLNEVQSNSGISYLTAQALNKQEELVELVEEATGEFEVGLADLKDTTQATPTRSADKPNLAKAIDDIKKVYSGVQRAREEPVEAAEALQVLVEKGLVTQEALDTYLDTIPISRNQGAVQHRQVVRELRERYYTVERRDLPSYQTELQRSDIESGNFKIVDPDTDEEVSDVQGFETGTLSADGTIQLEGLPEGTAKNSSKTLQIRPQRKSGRPTNLSSTTKRSDIITTMSSVEEELHFEIWACILLDVVAYIANTWERVDAVVDEMLDILVGQQSILRGAPLGPAANNLRNDSIQSLSEIKKNLNEIISQTDLSDNLLSIQETLANPSLNPANAGKKICDFNHKRYCNIHRRLDDLLANISGDLDLLEFSIGLGEIDFNLDEIVDIMAEFLLDLKEDIDFVTGLIEKLKGEACAFVSRNMKGTPKTLIDIESKISTIKTKLSARPSFLPDDWNLSESVVISQEIAKLGKAGYTAAVAALAAGDLVLFLALDEKSATFSGQIANCLIEAAQRCPDRLKSRRMEELAAVASARADQQILGQRIREGARRRRVLNTGASSVKAFNIEAIKLVAECAKDNV